MQSNLFKECKKIIHIIIVYKLCNYAIQYQYILDRGKLFIGRIWTDPTEYPTETF